MIPLSILDWRSTLACLSMIVNCWTVLPRARYIDGMSWPVNRNQVPPAGLPLVSSIRIAYNSSRFLTGEGPWRSGRAFSTHATLTWRIHALGRTASIREGDKNEPGKPQYVSDLVVYLLHELGIEYAILTQEQRRVGCMNRLVTYGAIRLPR